MTSVQMTECVKGSEQVSVNSEGNNSEFFRHSETGQFAKAMKAKYAFLCVPSQRSLLFWIVESENLNSWMGQQAYLQDSQLSPK